MNPGGAPLPAPFPVRASSILDAPAPRRAVFRGASRRTGTPLGGAGPRLARFPLQGMGHIHENTFPLASERGGRTPVAQESRLEIAPCLAEDRRHEPPAAAEQRLPPGPGGVGV